MPLVEDTRTDSQKASDWLAAQNTIHCQPYHCDMPLSDCLSRQAKYRQFFVQKKDQDEPTKRTIFQSCGGCEHYEPVVIDRPLTLREHGGEFNTFPVKRERAFNGGRPKPSADWRDSTKHKTWKKGGAK